MKNHTKVYMKEIWKDVVGYEGLYKCSSLGRIKSIRRIVKIGSNLRIVKAKILNPIKRYDGYSVVNFTYPKRKQLHVHRLIAQSFLPKIKDKDIVNHKDFDKSNNMLSNLEWCSQKENIYHSCVGERNGRIVLNIQTGIYYYSATEAAISICKNAGNLQKKLSGKIKNNTYFLYV